MTRDELLAELRRIKTEGGDPEGGHWLADEALLRFIGDDEVSAAFDAIDKWYA
jgi:hypothetical protein